MAELTGPAIRRALFRVLTGEYLRWDDVVARLVAQEVVQAHQEWGVDQEDLDWCVRARHEATALGEVEVCHREGRLHVRLTGKGQAVAARLRGGARV